MATHGTVKTTIVFLSLVLPVITFPEYYQRPTVKMRVRQHVSDTTNRNRYSSYINDTITHANLGIRSADDHIERQKDAGNDGLIIYPDTHVNISCTHGLCEHVVGYPKERITKLLSRSQFVNTYFEATEQLVKIDSRFKADEEYLCDTMIHTIYPEKAMNIMKVEKLIVNVEGHKQGIVFETCKHNGECKFGSTFPDGYTSHCEQKYIHKRLMVLGDNDKFVFDSFEVPSCCVCTVKKPDKPKV